MSSGVMRFLQIEWHKHERERNAWEIERAEMKARIGKLEGDLRTNKKLRESMDKHIRMLENALKKSREKTAKPQEQENGRTDGLEAKGSAKSSPSRKSHNSKSPVRLLSPEGEDLASQGLKHEAERERSRVYMGKCIEEFAYHVFSTTGSHQQYVEEEQLLQNNQFPNHQQSHDVSLEDVYAQQRQKQHSNVGSLGPSPLPNHQPPPVPKVNDVPPLSRSSHLSRGSQQAPEEPPFMSRNPPNRPQQERGSFVIERPSQMKSSGDAQADEGEKAYNNYGRQSRDEESTRIHSEPHIAETDGWNFDDASERLLNEQEPSPHPQSLRPDTDAFPNATNIAMKSPGRGPDSHRRKTSLTRRRQSDGSHELREISTSHTGSLRGDPGQFKVRFALRGHLDVVRSIIFTGGGSPSAPELCTAGDDGVVKRWIAGSTTPKGDDLDLKCDQTHRGHTGAVLCLAASPVYQPFSNGGRAQGDGWVFSGGQDATVRVWERGRVDPKATLDGHTDAVWTMCVLPGTSGSILGSDQAAHHGGMDRTIIASGAADGTILVWAVSSPPTVASPHTGSRRGTGGSRRANSVSSGSNFPSSPQPNASTASKPFHYSLVHRIEPRIDNPAPTCICPLSPTGETFVASFTDAAVLVYDTRTGEEIVGMASQESYTGTSASGVNAIAATTTMGMDSHERSEDKSVPPGPTGSSSNGAEGTIISGHEDRYISFFDANSGQCTYTMLAHPSPIASLFLNPSATELVSAGHDAAIRFWSLEKRSCTQEVNTHRLMRGEGVCAVVWSLDGRYAQNQMLA
ncbi:uncharacterized protein KY384_000130 [Bacidia gigantensis]|uniref:uncharacterized protein n=1 Tax=Bacidia gigantensis TaxID=2732470 RepID=UPI001D041347|nr:uncharacterized protein KY384_000130 [Bacidia gigantensis]KAG8526137.1 hypothetical protein KY384_000130 [Bacidia gigantensis]